MIIVIPTCPKYADILHPFSYCFKKHWPDCKYRKILINPGRFLEGFETFSTERDYGWVGNLLKFITSAGITENILLLLDDYLLMRDINEASIDRVNSFCVDNVGFIRLTPYSNNKFNLGYGWRSPSNTSYNEFYNYSNLLGLEGAKSPGLSLSLQPTIWSALFILRHFNPNFSPWQQEVLASRELNETGFINGLKCDKLLLTTKDVEFYYLNAIRDGKYSPEFAELARKWPLMGPVPWCRDTAIPFGNLIPMQKRSLYSRQEDGTYPVGRYY
jgi:hypothetical protein